MAYWARTVGHWWGYVGGYVVMAIIGTAILGYFVAGDPGGLFGLAEHVKSEPGNPKGAVLVLSLIFLGPLFNVYTAIVSAKSAIEADDDYHWSLKKLTHLEPPTPGNRRLAIAVLTFVPALLLLPFTFWMYTAEVDWLWQPDNPVYTQIGTYVAVAIVVLVYEKWTPKIGQCYKVESGRIKRIPEDGQTT